MHVIAEVLAPQSMGFVMSQSLQAIFEQLNRVFQDVFDDEELAVQADTTAQDVDGWTSLVHIRLVVSIEKAFNLRFTAAEIAGLKNVGDMANLIHRKQTSH
jgi:acyl carrier protein